MPAAQVGFRTALLAADQRSLRLRAGDPRVAQVDPDIVAMDLEEVVACVLPEWLLTTDIQIIALRHEYLGQNYTNPLIASIKQKYGST